MCALVSRHSDPQDRHDADFERNFWSAADLVDRSGRNRSKRHAQRPTPNNAARIGRVGALAVSLGVGFAVANSASVAYADVDADTSASAGSESQSRTKASSTKPSSRTDTEGTASPDAGSSDDGSNAEESGETEDADDPADNDGAEEEAAADDQGEASSPEEHRGDDIPTPASDVSEVPDASEATDTSTPAPNPGEGGVAEEVVAPDAVDVAPTEDAATDVVSVEVTAPAASAESAASAAPEDSTASVDVMTAVVSSVLSPFTDPATPARAPWFDAVLAWVRRQIVHTFFNETPEWGPVETQQIATGQVLIDLKARDPNGDPLTYTIVQPAHGVVFRDPLTGKFVYTPTTVVTGVPLQDSFKVTISDSSEHLKGLLGVVQGVFHFLRRAAGIAEPDEVTLMIPITVNPIVEIPPIVVTLPVAAGAPGSPVTVSPVVVITDLDSDEMTAATVTLSDPADGDVLGYGTLPTGVTVTTGVGTLTFTGAASATAYQQLLASVTLTTQTAAIKTVSFTVTDDQDLDSTAAATVVTVLGLPVDLPPLVVTSPVAVGTSGSAVVVSPIVVITDLDSDELTGATVKITSPEDGDVLSHGTLPDGVVVSSGEGSLTFSGTASVAAYQQLLASVTLTSQSAGIKTISFTVTDDEDLGSVPVATVVTMLGLPIEVPPLVVTTPIAAGTAGSAITVSPVVVITDLDSEQLSSATVTIANASDGDTLAHGALPPGVTATLGNGSVTFTGLASVSAYQQLLASVTMSSPTAAIKTVSFSVTDDQGLESATAATVVTVLGLPVQVPPLVVTSPVAVGTAGGAVQVSPIVVITDLDSDEIGSATVTVENYSAGDVLGYESLPTGVVVTTGNGSVTFTGAASVAAYQQLLASVTLTSSASGIKTVLFSVTDDQGLESISVATVVTLLGLPAELNPLVVTTPVSAGVAGSGITISPVVVIADLDSDELTSATVTINDAATGDVLGYGTLPTGVTAVVGNGSVTFTGAASVADYQQLLASVTLTSSSAGIKTVSFSVTDDQGLASPAAGTVVTVLGVSAQVPPLVVTTPLATGTAGTVTTISPIVVIADLDSDQIGSAAVVLNNPADGDVLGYVDVPDGVTITTTNGSLIFTGLASIEEYRQLLASVSLTSQTAGIKSISFTVVDDQGNESLAAGTVVTVLGLPVELSPLVVTLPVAAGTVGGAVNVSPVVVITDLDSDEMTSATVQVSNPSSGDVLSYGPLPTGVTVTTGAGSVTFSGAASVAVYRQLLQSVNLTSQSVGIKLVSFSVTDDQGNESASAATAVTVVGLSVEVPPLVVTTPVAAGTVGGAITISPVVIITDLDSDELDSATVTLDNPGAGDVLGFGDLPEGVTATLANGVLTFTGAASAAAYQQLLQSVTLTSNAPGIKAVSFVVTDDQGNASAAAGTLVTVVGLSVEVPPLVVTIPVAAGTVGGAITISPVVIITDLDSDELDSATVTLDTPGAGDVLGYGTLPSGVTVTTGAGSVTFTGAASAAAYQQLLQSVTLTSSTAGIRSVSFSVTDDQGNASVAAGTLVTVVGLSVEVPPLVVTTPVAAGTVGGATTVSPVVIITDLDSDELDSATVTLGTPGAGDVLGFGDLPEGVSATLVDGVLTFTGAASVAAYRQLLQSVTLTSNAPGIKSVSFVVTDDQGNASVAAGTLVTVVGLSVEVPPLVVTTPVAAGTVGGAITVSPVVIITDLDSDELDSATVTLDTPGVGDVLGYGDLPEGVTATLANGVLTFTGAASVAAYRQLLQSVTLTSSTAGIRSVSFGVTDDQGNESVSAATAVTVVGLSVEVPPLVVTTPVAAGTVGGAITISPVVIITDLDSDELDSATVTLDTPGAGDVLEYGDLPEGVSATLANGVLTFTGAASVAAYQQLLQSVTLTSSTAGIRSVSFSVTDDQGNASVAAGTLVTVVGLSVEVPPLVVTTPVAAGTVGGAITVSPVVIITDLDSDELDSATVTLGTPGAGDVLGYGTLPPGVTVTTGAGSVTFTGAASAAAYQQLLQSVTLTSNAPGIKSVSFVVTDVQGNQSAAAGTLVTVVGLSVEVPPLVVTTPVAAGTVGGAITISPVVIITDLDSDELDSATVTLDTPGAGDVLEYGDLPEGVTATLANGVLTFTGAASAAAYQQLLQSVTLTSQSAGIRSVSFVVTDVQGNASAAAGTLVTLVGLSVEVPPLVVTIPVAAGTVGGAITISPVVIITDLDSDELDSATVTLDTPGAGDVLGYGTLPSGVTVTTGAGSVTFTGAASAAAYQQLLQSVTLTSNAPGIKAVSFVVTDDQGNASAAAGTLVTVVGLSVEVPPLVVTIPVAAGTVGGAITISPVVIITDLDSDELDSATVTLDTPGAGDVLGYGTLPSGVTVTTGAGSVTFTGAASAAAYQQLLQSVTLTSNAPGIKSVSFVVTDVQGNQSAAAGTLVTVVGLSVEVPPLVVTIPVAAGTVGGAITISPVVIITDLDSDELDSATVTLDTPGAGDVLGYGTLPPGVTVTTGAGSVTFTGAASAAAYQQLLQSVTLTSNAPGIKSVSFVVTDVQGNASAAAGTLVTVVGLSVEVPPLVVTTPVAAGTVGGAITISPVVIITDLDSDELDSATVTLGTPGAGDVLGYGTLPPGVTVTTGAGSVTFTGAASAAAYQQLLQSVTLTSQSAGIRSVSFSVTDDQGNESVSAATAVTVVGLSVEVPPLVVTTPVAAGTVGGAITVSPVVIITDLDSDELDSATVTLDTPGAGDVLGYGTLPPGVTVTTGAGSVTFTGAASAAAYQQLLQIVTLTSQSAGIKSVSFTVTDSQGNESLAAVSAVTVIGLPTSDVTPLVVALPVAAGTTGSATVVSSVVVIADLDSDEIESATVIIDNPGAGDVLGYGSVPTGVTVTTGVNSVTFTGLASVAEYQQLLQSVTLTSSTAGIRSVSFTVTDDQGNQSDTAATAVTVVGLPTEVTPLVVALPVAAGTTGSATVVSSVVVIADLDSDEIESATVIVDNPGAGDVLGYGSVPTGITVTTGVNSVTFTGLASVAEYQQLLQSVTLTSSTAGIRSVSFVVIDDQGNESAASATAVTVVGLPTEVTPLVVALPVAAGTTGSATVVSSVVVIADLDSAEIESATVIVDNPEAGDVLGYGSLPTGITVTTGANSVTFTGLASLAEYQQLLQSVTLTSTTPGIRSVTFTVTDDQGNQSDAAATAVTVVGLPTEVTPLVVALPVAAGTTGSATVVSSVVVIADLDSDDIESATVTVTNPSAGDVLGYGSLPTGVVVTTGANSVTFTGLASVAEYQQLLQSVTLTSSTAGIRSVTFVVTDDQGNQSDAAATAVTVVGLPTEVTPLVVALPVAAGTTGSATVVSSVVVIADLDSDEIDSATVIVDNPEAGDVLGYGSLPTGITVTTGANSVTFTGLASLAEYQQLLQSVTLTSTTAGIRSVSFVVIDDQGNESAASATAVTVVGLPTEVTPLVVALPVAAGTTGSATVVSSVVVIADLDSGEIESATVTIDNPGAGDVLGYGSVPTGVVVTTGVNSVTFTGLASVAEYQQLLQSVTLTSTTAGIRSVSFTVIDDQGNQSDAAATAVTVVGLPTEVTPLVVALPVAAGTTGSATVVSSVVVIADLDSDEINSATVTVTNPSAGDVLGYGSLPTGVTVTTGANSVTFTGLASVAEYQQLLQSVTLTSTTAGIRSVSFVVTDDQGNQSDAAATVVTVVGLPTEVTPLVVALPVSAGTTGSATVVSSVVVIADLDSDDIESATVTVDNPEVGDVLGYGSVPTGITVTTGVNSVTFTGLASVAEYQQLLQSVTLTSSTAGIRSVSFVVTDDQGNQSDAAATAVTVVGLPTEVTPLVVALPVSAGTTGSATVVSSVVVIADLDSEEIDSATVTIDNAGPGDVLGYGSVPTGITVTAGANSVTFTGLASVAEYQQLLQSVTLTSTTAGIRSVSFTVIDDQGNVSAASATAVTVVGLPTEVTPLVVALPVAAGTTGSATVVSSVVVIADLDSDEINSATVTVTNPSAGDVLGYGSLPTGVTVTTGANSVTFTGLASVAEYQQLLQSVTLTSTTAGIRSVSFTVIDDQGNVSAASATAVTVVGLPTEVTPLVVALPVAAGTTGSATVVSSVVVIADLDSDEIESATVTVDNPGAGDVLGYGSVPTGITVTTGVNSVTFTGLASVAEYQQLLQSVTLTSSTAGIRSVTFVVTDDQGNQSDAAATAVTVVGLPTEVTPLVVALPVSAGTTGSATVVSSVVVIADLDSDDIESATVTVDNPGAGDVLGYGSVPTGITVTTGANSVTFTGLASVAEYQQLLQSVTLTSSTAGIRSVSFVVIDDQGNQSDAAATAVTVVGLPTEVTPLVVALPVAAGTVGSATVVSSVVVIADLDSGEIESATVTIDNPGAGDVLGYGSVPTGITVTMGANSVKFTGLASVAEYQQLLQSVTLTSSTAGIRSVSFTVIDDQGNESAASATAVTVVGLPTEITPLVVALPAAAGTTGSATVVSSVVVIADLDSDEIDSATVTVDNPQAGDVLGYGSVPTGITVTTGANSVTFTGLASLAEYQQLLQSVTLTSSTAGIRSVSFVVTDDQGNQSDAAATALTVVGLPTEVTPLVVALPAAGGTVGTPTVVSSVIVIADLDSDEIESATVTIDNPGAGDVLGYGSVPTGITVTAGANSVTFTGLASVADYQQLLQSVTLTSTTAGIRSVSFVVTDDQGNQSDAATTAVTVVGLSTEVTPLVVALPVATGTAGTPTVVSSVIVIADLDSGQIDSATVTITNPSAGDVLGYGSVPAGITVTTGANSVTFTGPATVAEYQQLLASVTLTSQTIGITRVSFTVTDDQGNVSAEAGTAVTVVGVPTAATPLVVTSLVNVAYTAGGSSVAVDPGVIVLDVDSTTMNGATVAITDPDIGDTLTWGSLPTGITADYDNGVLTFSGSASIDDYQQLLRTVRFSTDASALATIKSIEFQVTDDSNRASTPALVTVTVVSLPITATPAVVTSVVNVSYTAGNSATVIDPNLTILDADSSNMSGAVVSIVGGVTAGEELSFTPQAGISGTYNPATGMLTFSGTATKDAYQQLLRSVTFEADPAALATIKSISFVITDAQSNTSGPGLVAVTILNAPVSVAPLVITSGVNLTYTAGNSPVTVDSGVSLLDLDSSTLQGATVRISGGFASGDELTFTAPSGITGNYNAATGVLTFTGDASLADYQTALRSVQLSTDASALAAIKTVSFAVTDLEGSASLPGSVAVTVLAAPVNLAPLVTTLLGPIYTAGNTAVQVNPLLTVLDLDTANMGGATVAITGNFAAGDVLSFTPTSGIVGNFDPATGVLTFVGNASTATYQQILRSVTFSSGASGTTMVKTITFTVTDSLGATSPNATALVTQTANSAPLLTAPLGGGVLLLGAQVVSPTAVIVDDSSFLDQAVVTITNVQSVDVLSFTATGSITGSYSGGVLTLSGLGTVAEYQSVLQSVRFSKTGLNLLGFRNITMVVRDAQGLNSNTTSGTLTLIL